MCGALGAGLYEPGRARLRGALGNLAPRRWGPCRRSLTVRCRTRRALQHAREEAERAAELRSQSEAAARAENERLEAERAEIAKLKEAEQRAAEADKVRPWEQRRPKRAEPGSRGRG